MILISSRGEILDMDKLLFVINPKAGKITIKDDLFNIIEIFSKEFYRF